MCRLIHIGVLAGALTLSAFASAQTLKWPSQGDPLSMDPHAVNESLSNVMNGQVYERLVSRDRQLAIIPSLATEWTQVSPLVWRFKLRPNVKFHDGTPFTADDVVYSIQRATLPTTQISNYAADAGTRDTVEARTIDS